MTNLHESVYLRFRGRTRRLPLVAIATALRRDARGAVQALEILIQGPPENREPTPAEHAVPSERNRGEGVRGGVYPERSERRAPRSETIGTSTFPQELEERSDRERSDAPARERDVDDDAFARSVAIDLGDEDNLAAIRKLVLRHPRLVLEHARRAALAVPGDRVRSSRGAIFTGIVRKLAADGGRAPTP